MRCVVLLAALLAVCVHSATEKEIEARFHDILEQEGIVFPADEIDEALGVFELNCFGKPVSKCGSHDLLSSDEKLGSLEDGRTSMMKKEVMKDTEVKKLENLVLQKREESVLLNTRAPSYCDSRQKYAINEPVNQGKCGNCYLHTFIAALEIAYAKHTISGSNPKGKLVKFAEQELTDCYHRGCHGGDYRNVAKTVAVTDHLCLKKDYGSYLSFMIKDNFVCRAATTPDALVDVKVTGYVDVTTANVEAAVSNYGSVMTCVDWNNRCPDIDDYTGGVYSGPTVPNGCDHAVLIVGYTPDYYIVRNSHGKDWGENGYIRVKRNRNVCGIEDQMAALVTEKRRGSKGTAGNGCPRDKPKWCADIHACVPGSSSCSVKEQEEKVQEQEQEEQEQEQIEELTERGRVRKKGWQIPGRTKRDVVAVEKRCADTTSGCAAKKRFCSMSAMIPKVCAATCGTCDQALPVKKEKTKPKEVTGKCYKPTIANGRVLAGSYINSGDTLRVACNSGYVLEGESVKCLIADVFYNEKTKDGRLMPECVKRGSETLSKNGVRYEGTVSKTVTGKTCDSWNAEILRGELALDEKEAGMLLVGNNNLCRNPGGTQPVPFCVVGQGKLEYCFKYPGCDTCAGAVDQDRYCDDYVGQCAFSTTLTKIAPTERWKTCTKTCCRVAGC